jgi:hypothetical protein
MTLADVAIPDLYTNHHKLDMSPEYVGLLRNSMDAIDDVETLRQRMTDEGYLFLPGLLDRERVLKARRILAERLLAEGLIDPTCDVMECVATPNAKPSFRDDLARNNPALDEVVYDHEMMEFFGKFLGGPVLHFDFTWLRVMGPGVGTPSHCDVVYMGRGTHNLYTAWTPLGDIPYHVGGLMVLEGSNNNQRLRNTYGKYDVDTYCENRPHLNGWKQGGHLSDNPNQIRRSIGGKWRVGEYRAGDVLIFSIRISSDTRYQLATEAADERWIGPNPIAHSQAGKRGRIC